MSNFMGGLDAGDQDEIEFEEDFENEFSEFAKNSVVDREATPSHGLLDSEFEEYRDSFQNEDEDSLDDDENDVLNPSDWLGLSQEERQNRMNSMSNSASSKQESIMQNYFEGDEDEESEDDFFEDDEDDFDF